MTTLPPLPEFSKEFWPRWPSDIGGYTVEAMRSYGAACAAAALAQEPQAEPVAYLHREEGHADVVILAADWDGPCADCIPLYAHGITEAP